FGGIRLCPHFWPLIQPQTLATATIAAASIEDLASDCRWGTTGAKGFCATLGCMSVPVKLRAKTRPRRNRPRRDLKAMEARRMQAADRYRRGVIPAEIARQLGVSHQIVSEWRKAWQQGRRAALRSAGG